jgi:hypothetical protein
MNMEGSVNDASPRRPARFGGTPELELDCRTQGSDGIAVLRTVMKEAQRLPPGRMLAIRIGFEPAFLCRALAGKGFSHWPESMEGGEWRIYFLRPERNKPRRPHG